MGMQMGPKSTTELPISSAGRQPEKSETCYGFAAAERIEETASAVLHSGSAAAAVSARKLDSPDSKR